MSAEQRRYDDDVTADIGTATRVGTQTKSYNAGYYSQVTPRPAERKQLIGLDIDVYLLMVAGILVAIGLMMVFSTTFDWSYSEFGNPAAIFFRQLRSLMVGLAVMGLLAWIDYRRWRLWIIPITILVIGVLAFLLTLPEHEELGGRRALFGDSVQPGELAELVMIVYLAAWLSSKRAKLRKLTYGLIPFSLLVGVVCALIIAQPDLSTALLIFVVSVTMFYLAGADVMQLLLVGAIAGGLGIAIVTQLDYARVRVEEHLTALSNITEADWHIQRAVIAFREGGLGGVGLGESREKFGYLPTPHTDSVFAVIGEELGLIGCILVVALFVVLVYRGFTIARRAPDPFGAILAAGVSCWIVFQALLNMAVLVGIIPFTGVPLPFISFGGSSLVVSLAGVGFLLSISRVTARTTMLERKKLGIDEDAEHGSSAGAARDYRSRRNRRRRISRTSRRRHIGR